MAKARLNYEIELDYSDSGIPQIKESGGCYNTLICVHGPLLNRGIFSLLFPVVPPASRLITYNHRGFKGSSPISTASLSGRISTRETYVNDLVSFLEWINKNLQLPKAPFILSWGKAGNILLALASPTLLEPSLRRRGLSNVTGLILFDSPGTILGRPPTKDIVDSVIGFPLLNSGNSEKDSHSCVSGGYCSHKTVIEKLVSPPDRFIDWICGFYKHTLPPERGCLRQPCFYNSWSYKCSSNLERKAINAAYQPETYDSLAEFFKMKDGICEQREFAIEALVGQRDVPVTFLWNGESPECMIDAAKGAIELGADVRMCSEKGNALFFVHEPRRFWGAVKGVMEGMGKV